MSGVASCGRPGIGRYRVSKNCRESDPKFRGRRVSGVGIYRDMLALGIRRVYRGRMAPDTARPIVGTVACQIGANAMSLYYVEFLDGTDGLSTVCQPVVAPSPDHAADIAYRAAGHIAATGAARVVTMTVTEVATARTAPVVIDTPVSLNDFLSHVNAWLLFYSDGRTDIESVDYPWDIAYAGNAHASSVAMDALRAAGVLA